MSPNPPNDFALRRAILVAAVLGLVVFTLLFAASLRYPTVLEQWARQAIAQEVQQRVETQLDGLSNSALGSAASGVIEANKRQQAAAREPLAQALPSKISIVMAAMLDPECTCRKAAVDPNRDAKILHRAKILDNNAARSSIAELDKMNARLTGLIESKYRDVAQSLHREVRIFSGANALVFLLLAVIALVWKRRAVQLLAPTVVLVGAAAITGAIYLFNQDWLQTVLFNDYVGLWYLPYLGVALAFMLDVVFNRGQISLKLAMAAGLVVTAPLSGGC